MPLSINVGLSRKASRDYQSTGVSINVNAELDQTLLARPDELQQRIDELYEQARLALDRQAELPPESAPQMSPNGRNQVAANSTMANSNHRPYRGGQGYRGYDRIQRLDQSEGQIRGERGERWFRGERGNRQFREDRDKRDRGYRSWDRRDGNGFGGNGNGHGNGNNHQDNHNGGNHNGARYSRGAGMTQSQQRAIEAIAQRLGIDAAQEIHHEFGLDLEQLSIRQASQAIDHLKQLQPLNQNQDQPANSSHAANTGNPNSSGGVSVGLTGGSGGGGNGQHE